MSSVEPRSAAPPRPPRLGRAGALWVTCWLVLGVLCLAQAAAPGLWPGLLGGPEPGDSDLASAAPGHRPHATRPIEQIRVGQRVLARNPQLAEAPPAGAQTIDPSRWRKLSLRMTKNDGSRLDIELLRPAVWIELTGAEAGKTIHLDLPELGADGPAAVLAVEPCPPIQAGRGRVVTGTFAHQSADVLDLHVAGLDEPVGVTAAHPFWSDDRQDFVPAGMLRPGERLLGLGGPARVASIVPRASPQRVYNLEVDVEHVYYVTGRGLLVHNNGCGNLVTMNRLKGLTKQGQFAKFLKRKGFDVVGKDIKVRTVLGVREMDVVVRTRHGVLHGIETKAGGGVRKFRQLAKDATMNILKEAKAFGKQARRAEILNETIKTITTVLKL